MYLHLCVCLSAGDSSENHRRVLMKDIFWGDRMSRLQHMILSCC